MFQLFILQKRKVGNILIERIRSTKSFFCLCISDWCRWHWTFYICFWKVNY